MVLGKQEILFTFCHPLFQILPVLRQGQDTLFTVNLPTLLPLTYYTYNERSLFLVWVAGGGRRSAELNFSPLSARWPALAVVTWFRKFLSLVCSVDRRRGGPYLACRVWLHNWNQVYPLPPFFLPMLSLQNILVRDIKSAEAQKPKTFWVATFCAQKLSGWGARYYF